MTSPAGQTIKPLAADTFQPLLQGRQNVSGIWFPSDRLDDARAASRIIAAWQPGGQVWRFDGGWLLRLREAVELDCALTGGWPLLREGNALCSAHLISAERDRLPAADVWIIRGGHAAALAVRDATAIDPGSWFDIEGYAFHDSFDCHAAASSTLTPAIAEPRELRTVLGAAVPPASPKQKEFLRELSGRSADVPRPGGSGGAGGVAKTSAPIRAMIPPRGLERIMPQRWRTWLAKLAMMTRASKLIGRRQAAYIRKMLEMFDRGDLDQALRHAIPLGADDRSTGQAFGAPSARDSLTLSQKLGASASIHLGSELNAHLRNLYRKSFERLDRAGRIDEAVFVLAELLSARKEALDYLEKHERYKQAAELALAWDMPADQIVRMHCLAGDWRTALAVARRDNAFANSVSQLRDRWPDAAARLRREWGQALADQGNWLAAIEAIWPIEDARDQAIEWLRQAESAQGDLSARGLVLRAALMPDTLSIHADKLKSLRENPDLGAQRNAIAEALLDQKYQTEALRSIAAMLAGPILADHARGHGRLDRQALQRIVNRSQDRLLQTDLPGHKLPGVMHKPLAQSKDSLHLIAPDPGARALLDVAPLDAGRYLVAIGESGALIVNAFGDTLNRFAIPAERLVIAHSRQIALALARREDAWRVSRLDLVNRQITDLGMLSASLVAPRFDGIAWTVVTDNRLCVLDTSKTLHDVLWHVELPGRALALSWHESREQIAVEESHGITLWQYQLPQRRLISRDPIPDLSKDTQFRAFNPRGGYVEGGLSKTPQGQNALYLRQPHPRQIALRDGLFDGWLDDGSLEIACFAGDDWTMVRCSNANGQSVWQLIGLGKNHVSAEITWPACDKSGVRMIGAHCVLFDSDGRVLDLDTETSQVTAFSVR